MRINATYFVDDLDIKWRSRVKEKSFACTCKASFQVASADQARGLASAFAKLVIADAAAKNPFLKIGAIGNPGSGKSTLLKAMIGALDDNGLSVQKAKTGDTIYISQKYGKIRHIDTFMTDWILRRWQTLPIRGDRKIEFVEHPQHAIRRKFNLAMRVELSASNTRPDIIDMSKPEDQRREITFYADPEIGESPAFQAFVNRAREICPSNDL